MITEREIFLTDPEEKQKVIDFLKEFDLTFTGNIDYTMGLFDDNRLIGTGSLGGRVMRDIAISSDYQKKGLTHRIMHMPCALYLCLCDITQENHGIF